MKLQTGRVIQCPGMTRRSDMRAQKIRGSCESLKCQKPAVRPTKDCWQKQPEIDGNNKLWERTGCGRRGPYTGRAAPSWDKQFCAGQTAHLLDIHWNQDCCSLFLSFLFSSLFFLNSSLSLTLLFLTLVIQNPLLWDYIRIRRYHASFHVKCVISHKTLQAFADPLIFVIDFNPEHRWILGALFPLKAGHHRCGYNLSSNLHKNIRIISSSLLFSIV